jgi:hypothetical protein
MMTIPRQQVDAIRDFGYKHSEAQFLYLAATHSGYFTGSQYLRFIGQNKGFPVHRFTAKAVRYRHARALEYGGNTFVFNLCSGLIYSAIDRESFRPRPGASNDLILARLLTLDFVIAHPNHAYLETEAQKIDHFHRNLGVPLSALPGRVFKGLKATCHSPRYFVDRWPIFLAPADRLDPRSPIPNFVYCDSVGKSLVGLTTHLRRYEKLLRRLPAFNFIYASATAVNFDRAEKLFASTLARNPSAPTDDVIRYFQIRQLWESHKTATLTRTDRDYLRAGDQRYHGELFESAYGRWAAQDLSEIELGTLLQACPQTLGTSFSTFLLPTSYPIFQRRSLLPLSPSAASRWGREELSLGFPTHDSPNKD